MGHKLTIEVSEAAFAALQAAAASASRTPEELAAETVKERFNEPFSPILTGQVAREAIRAVMRADCLTAFGDPNFLSEDKRLLQAAAAE